MILKSARVQNFRSILEETLLCDELTALVGANGAGKSAFGRALALFYDTSLSYSPEDFYNRDTNRDIEITLTFTELDPEEKQLFAPYLQNEDLTVTRVVSLAGDKRSDKYHGSTLQNPEFDAMRAAPNAAEMKAVYNQLQTQKYTALPKWTKKDDALDALRNWEGQNPQECTWKRDGGQFFGFKEVAQGYLGRHTRLIYIPAVRDAADDALESRGSVITELMDLVVRSVLEGRADVKAFREEVQRRYGEVFDPAKLDEITGLAAKLTGTLSVFAPGTKVNLTWSKFAGLDLPMPKADLKLEEDGFTSAVERAGHGLQRAFILTLLQHLEIAQAVAASAPPTGNNEGQPNGAEGRPAPKGRLPNLLLCIEEPELYQHPGRERHLANILLKLATGKIPGVADRTQVIYSTHSPLFVGVDRFNHVRMVRKVASQFPGQPKVTTVVRKTLDDVAALVWETDGRSGEPYTAATLQPRLVTLLNPWMSEGFFSAVVLLVEGEDDRAALLATADLMGHDLEALNISVIPCLGKSNMYTAGAIFQSFGVPIYCLWDGDAHLGATGGVCEKCGRAMDKKCDPRENHRLLRLMGRPVEDWPEYIDATSACFKCDLETGLKGEIGVEVFDQLLEKQMAASAISKKTHALKNPAILKAVMGEAKTLGKSSKSLESIIRVVLNMTGTVTHMAAAQ